MPRVTIVGSATGREHMLARAFAAEPGCRLSAILWADHPFVRAASTGGYHVTDLRNVSLVLRQIIDLAPDYVIVAQGEALQYGLIDQLRSVGIPAIGPTQAVARLEGSKAFLRTVMNSIDPSIAHRYAAFDAVTHEFELFLTSLGSKAVLKCDGVVRGPRVRIYDLREGGTTALLRDARRWIADYGSVLLEEHIAGHEVAIMSYCDGSQLFHSPPFRNYKRVYDHDCGDNTSGMGSFTSGPALPFMSDEVLQKLHRVSQSLFEWILRHHGIGYVGSLYGEFFVLPDGQIRVIEYNCRFGNPSSINMYWLLEVPFPRLFEALVSGGLANLRPTWRADSTVSAYVVPQGFTEATYNVGAYVDFEDTNPEYRFLGYLDFSRARPSLRDSRGLAICASGSTADEARRTVYGELAKVRGPIHFRTDVGITL